MNNEIIKQSLVEAFEVLKDSWETKSEAIINCIVETENYDGSLAMDMWIYILQNNVSDLGTSDGINKLFDSILFKFHDRNCSNWKFLRSNLCKTIIEHIVVHLDNKVQFVKAIMGNALNGGYSAYWYYGDYHLEALPAFISCIIASNNPKQVSAMMQALASNILMIVNSVGELLNKSLVYYSAIKENHYDFEGLPMLSNEVREVMLRDLSLISNKEDRAESTIAILSF